MLGNVLPVVWASRMPPVGAAVRVEKSEWMQHRTLGRVDATPAVVVIVVEGVAQILEFVGLHGNNVVIAVVAIVAVPSGAVKAAALIVVVLIVVELVVELGYELVLGMCSPEVVDSGRETTTAELP